MHQKGRWHARSSPSAIMAFMNFTRPCAIPTAVAALTLATLLAGCGSENDVADTPPPESIPAESLEGSLLITPAQPEGPYYPKAKPADIDNDLTSVSGSNVQAHGEQILLEGLLLWRDGTPVGDAAVEIWQADAAGSYLHPDFESNSLDPGFQYYGEAVVDPAGEWRFTTLLPASYENRPRHIHAKVIVAGDEMLTTQIYFGGAKSPSTEDIDDLLVIEVYPVEIAGSEVRLAAGHVIVLAG